LHKDKKLSVRQNQRETDAIGYIIRALSGHQPQVFECIHTGDYYLLLPKNMLRDFKNIICSLGDGKVKVKIINKGNRQYTKIISSDILQLEYIVKEMRKIGNKKV
jgi:hypothetical protein